MDLLLECYSYLPFEQRVRTASAWQIEALRWAAGHQGDILQAIAMSQRPPERVAVRYRLEAAERPVTIPTRSPRTLDGAPVEVTLPHIARFVGVDPVERPAAYAVPPPVAAHLRRHGLAVRDPDGRAVDARVARVVSVGAEAGRAILEASAVGEVEVEWRRVTDPVPPGWSLVETEQPLGAIAVYLCEPCSDDGLVENGVIEPVPVGSDHPAWRVVG
jgi:hypothetical protein